ncbi:DUF3604 domain-containing protein [Chloroflexota bacterium]
MQDTDLGRASIDLIEPVEAGSFVTITYTFTCGHSIDDGGSLKLAFRLVGDFGTPQFTHKAEPNYFTISTSGYCSAEPRWDPRGHIRPWSPSLIVKITKGFLNKGDKITIVFGDRSGGCPGWQIQTFCEDTFEIRTIVDPIATSQFKAIIDSPTLRVVPGKPVKVVCVAPSRVCVNQSFIYHLKLEDKWGNPTCKPIKLEHPGFTSDGIQQLTAKHKDTGFIAQSNPIEVASNEVGLHLYWADLHGQSEETVGTNTIDDYFAFARDYGLLDICAHQGNDFQISDDFWKTINKTAKQFYKKSVFVTFPGYEWSGNTPLGGDRNVYFFSEGGSITRSSRDLLLDKRSVYDDSTTATELFANLRKQQIKSFAFAHVGGRWADLDMHDPDIEIAIEVHSAWGTFDWIVEDALKRGYRIGICANSDGHKGRPGASYPGAKTFGSIGGLTCILAEHLDRDSVFEAIKARHFYGTTGNRSLLSVNLRTNDQVAMMGDVVFASKEVPMLDVLAAGTSPVESVTVNNGVDVIKTIRPYSAGGNRIKIIWGGAETRGRARMVRWDGHLSIQDNEILSVNTVNFLNTDNPLERQSNELRWQSITTGGDAGIILELVEPDKGSIQIDTVQGNLEVDIASIGIEPRVIDYSGLNKRMEVYRLPSQPSPSVFTFNLPLIDLHKGDNPIYIKMMQEDGHIAWSSPIYLVR